MNFWETLITFVVGFLGKRPKELLEVSIPLGNSPSEEVRPEAPPKIENMPSAIDWTNKDMQVTDHFTVGDCLTLHAWNRLATESDGVTDDTKTYMVELCQKMEKIRTILGCPMNVHCIYRSPEYNTEVVGAIANDVHSLGQAIDFDCNGHHTIDEVHAILEPLLEQNGLRMERNTNTWIHLDIHPVKNARYFTA